MSDLPAVLDAGLSPAVQAHLDRRMIALIDAAFDEIQDSIDCGDQATKQATIRALLPALVKARQQGKDNSEGDDAETIHEATRDLFAGIGESLRG